MIRKGKKNVFAPCGNSRQVFPGAVDPLEMIRHCAAEDGIVFKSLSMFLIFPDCLEGCTHLTARSPFSGSGDAPIGCRRSSILTAKQPLP